MSSRRQLGAIAAIGLLNLVALSAPALFQNYDSQTHLFFADHYRRAWFDPWDPKWFDGMWMFSYPPLVHQLIALVGTIFDVELGYRVVQGAALLVFPLAIRQLAIETVGPRYANWAALLAVGVPGIYVELYAWGQLPSFVGMVLAIGASAFFGRFLRTGRPLALATCVALTGAATAAHHHAVVFIMPPLMTAVVLRWWLIRPRRWWVALGRPALACLLSAAVAVAAILPFWWWYANFNLPQAELPHPSRDGIFRTAIDSELFFWGIYGAFLVLAPVGFVMLVMRRRSAWPLGAVILLLGLLGLGTLTPLPGLLFAYGDLWRWLVYERFAVWAAVLSTLPASVFVEYIAHSRLRWPLGGLITVALLFGVAREATFTQVQPLIPRPLQAWEETEVLGFLASDDHAGWNYVTFGMGEAEMARLSRLTADRSMDGLYYTARERPELRASGVGSIDSAYWWRTGMEILPEVIQHPDHWNLKWAVVALPQLEEQLQSAGWQKLYNLGSRTKIAEIPAMFFEQSQETQAAFRATYGDQAALVWAAQHGAPANTSLVSMWQAPDGLTIPPLPPVVVPPYPPFLAYWWGTVPLLLLVLGAGLVFLERWRRRAPRPRPVATAAQPPRRRLGRYLPPVFGALLPWHRS